jgi:hypothetical protein
MRQQQFARHPMHEAPARAPREQERARQHERDHPVPDVLGEFLQRRDVLKAGVGDDRIEPPEAAERGRNRRSVGFGNRQIGEKGLTRP